jgi:2-oxoglutarate dehydrogenase E2 component (dihydrolipoamide succinyltransferase)
MPSIELIMPKLGESVMEATILSWEKKVGDSIELDENVLTIATDKVDTEVPSPVAGILSAILFEVGAVVKIGTVIAVVSTDNSAAIKDSPALPQTQQTSQNTVNQSATAQNNSTNQPEQDSNDDRFYSPLVKSIAKTENISNPELQSINGSGQNGRVTKYDILAYVETKKQPQPSIITQEIATKTTEKTTEKIAQNTVQVQQYNIPAIDKSNSEIIEMDRMRRLIADHMVMSKHVSPHVASFVEVDVTNIVQWREKNKAAYEKKYGEKITFTPIFMEATLKALQDFPMINVSVEGTNIIRHKSFNLGMATALPTGNLIVPVIKNAENLNLNGLTKAVNDLANRARTNKLKPDDIQGGTFTLTNVGSFGSVMGLPIINQPQAAIMAIGTIKKKPAVLETPNGDVIAIRQLMFLSLSYDHRVVDGALGSSFLRRVADYMESFDLNRTI